jgi:DNA (cytosine-5)-methyltransferase 1
LRLGAADYGVAQARTRLLVVAMTVPFIPPAPTHGPVQSQMAFWPRLAHRTVAEAIGDLPPPDGSGEVPAIANHVDVTPARDRTRIHGGRPGECLARSTHLNAKLRGRLDPDKDTTKWRRLAWDAPSLTLRGGEAFYHPEEDRYLTPRECARLHGFADDHELYGPLRARSGRVRDLDQHRQVAGAVPPPLARALGEAIAAALASSDAFPTR